jgi:ATP/maltotriose-dependent transcriptional regulator MalT/DNA-binding SARP family transcriptional activator
MDIAADRGGQAAWLPPAPPSLLQRPRLEDLLDEAFGKRLTLVLAGAGYGKSTLLRAWASDLDSAWYSLGPESRTAASFARGLATALRPCLPAVADELVQTLTTAHSRGDRASETLAVRLSESFQERLTHDFTLILDDVHELESAPGPVRLLETLCRHAPATLHLVLASRSECPFPIARLRGQGEVLELVGSQLAFDLDEVTGLLVSTLGEDARSLADAVHDVTEGWPAAVRLAIESLRAVTVDRRAAAVETIGRPEGPLFPYLAEEVFGREGPETRRLLRVASAFDSFVPELCEALGCTRAEEAVAGLLRRGLLVQAAGGNDAWLSLHALVREFARRNWPLSEPELRGLYRRAAGWFQSHGFLEQALRSVQAAADPRLAASFLRRHGQSVLPWGAADLIEVYPLLSPELRDVAIEQLLGDARYAAGDFDQARAHFERAAGGSDELPAALAHSLALTHYPNGNLDEAIQTCARARIDGRDPTQEALVLALWSNACGLRGRLDAARTIAGRALEAAKRSGDDRALAFAHHALALAAQLAGERRLARDHYQRELAAAMRADEVLQVARARNNLAADLLDAGEPMGALEHVEIALSLAERHGLGDFMPVVLGNRAEVLRELGRFDEAIASLDAVRRLLDREGSEFREAALFGLAEVYRERGDIALARAGYERHVARAETARNTTHLRLALAGLARTLVEDDPEEARRLAERAVEMGPDVRDGEAYLAYGWVLLALGERRKAEEASADAERVGRERDVAGLIAQSLELRAVCATDAIRTRALLEEAVAIWRSLENPLRTIRAEFALARFSDDADAGAAADRAERRLRATGINVAAAGRAAGLLAAIPPPEAPPVAIRSLGGFHLLREGQPIAPDEWQSKKARDLLKLLVARRCRPVPRDVLIEALWPGQDPQAVTSRLSVVLSLARAVLDPVKAFDPQHILASDRETVTLVRSNVAVDVETFSEEAAAALALYADGRGNEAGERLEYAASLYGGDFLEDDPYSDWAVPLREQARTLFIDVLRALAEQSTALADHDRAARFLLRILERDPYDERAHLALVAAFQQAGRQGDARRHFGSYMARMDEIGVEAAAYPAALRSRA